MIWQISWDERARQELRKLDRQAQKDILRYMQERIATGNDPRRFGKPLSYDKHGLWRYRIRDYRVICKIYDDEMLVLAVRVGH